MVEGLRSLHIDVSTWHANLASLYRYWLGIHPPAGGLPGRQHVDPAEIRCLLPQLWMMDIQHAPFRLRYRLVGTRICELAGRELTGQWFDEVNPDLAGNPIDLERFRAAARDGVPSRRRGPPTLHGHLPKQADFTEIESLALPLAKDGRTVDILMCYTVFYRLNGIEY